jgi:cell division septal protein FtsQ
VRRDLARIGAALLALASAAALYAALSGPFVIRDVAVSGSSRVPIGEIRAAAALDGARVFAASARAAEARIAALPAVRRARVTLQLPDRALIDVDERRPAIAVASAAGKLYADADGALFSAAPVDGIATLEDETTRRVAGGRIDTALVGATLAIATREPAYFGHAIERIRLTSAYGLVVTLAGPLELRIGGADQIDQKLEAARQIVLSRAGKRLDYVDVRNRENPVFFPN